ncbi:MAG TPA: glycosyltransferase [Verrucomicrobiae bacterium]|nr:glycosyltransferase [Verrucomicrobiae bacterium]
MRISIIVPAFNEEKLIDQSLAKIKAATASFSALGWESEIIVCDNNSTDRTAKMARSTGAKVVFEPVNQISRARNRGAAAAVGDWLIFVDADSFPSLELFADVGQVIQGGKCIGGGAAVVMDRDGWGTLLVGVWNLLSRFKRWAAGSFVFCEAAAFRQLNGFSQELYAAEEIEFSVRLKRLARNRGKQVVILRRNPLLTSARKMHLYSFSEHLRLMFWTVMHGGRNLKKRSACALWYDGRR